MKTNHNIASHTEKCLTQQYCEMRYSLQVCVAVRILALFRSSWDGTGVCEQHLRPSTGVVFSKGNS